MDDAFGPALRAWRTAQGWSLRTLAESITYNRTYIGNVEQQAKFPHREFAVLADNALSASGQLVTLWEAQQKIRQDRGLRTKLLSGSVADSHALIGIAEEGKSLDELHQAAEQLSVDYLSTAPSTVLVSAIEVRREVLTRLRKYNVRPHQLGDLYLTLARVQGVLSYAALDLGDTRVARTHCHAAWACADRIGSNSMRAWVRGTESLIARFDQNYAEAERIAFDGLRYPTNGTARIRLLAGIAQSRANQGDSETATDYLAHAQHERDALKTSDETSGLFSFTQAKQHYYAGSSLMWLSSDTNLRIAVKEAALAVQMWQKEPTETRSLDDEALAHVYAATAHVQLGELDAASEWVASVLQLPADRHISWFVKRLDQLSHKVSQRFPHSSSANELTSAIRTVTE
jgi:transcriptional regulator with XRE-family HTH domain